jgi:hypothetical protein
VFCTLLHCTMLRNQWHLCLLVDKRIYIKRVFLPFQLSLLDSAELDQLFMESLAKSMSCDHSFYLDALECSHSWYTVHSTFRGYGVCHKVRVPHPWVQDSWMLLEWIFVYHLTPHDLKKFQSLLAIWSHQRVKWRNPLFLTCLKRMYIEITPSSIFLFSSAY